MLFQCLLTGVMSRVALPSEGHMEGGDDPSEKRGRGRGAHGLPEEEDRRGRNVRPLGASLGLDTASIGCSGPPDTRILDTRTLRYWETRKTQ